MIVLMPRVDVRRLVICAMAASFGLSACAAGQRASRSGPALPDPGPLAEGWLLPARYYSGQTKAEVSAPQMFARLKEARVVYVSENHRSPHHHAVQLKVIDQLRALEPSISIGLEMIKRPFQGALDAYVAGEIDEAQLLEQTEWNERWGFDFALYRPIFQYARKYKLRLHALNMRDEVTKKVSKVGVEGLSTAERNALPELDLNNEEHKEAIRASFGAHHHHGGMNFDHFYAAQVIWDETMAHEVDRALKAPNAPKLMVVLAGSGHIHYGLGIPMRAARRGAEPYQLVTPVLLTKGSVEEILTQPPGDFVWVMAR